MTSSTTRRAHYIIRNIWLVRTQPTLVLCRTAVRASRSIRLPQCSIQLGQFAQLHATQIIVSLWHFDALPDNVLDFVDSLFYAFRISGCDECVQWLILAGQRLTVFATDFAFLDGSLAANYYFGTGFLFHCCRNVG